MTNSKLYIVTVATEIKYYMKYLIESIKKFNGELTILGFAEQWKGFNWRFKKTIEFLSQVNPNDVVCFIDGYDVICTRDLTELLDIFTNIVKREGCKIIIGHDKVVNPLSKIFQYLYFGKCQNDYINAGTYIGYAKDLLDILNYIHKYNDKDNQDDQILLTNYCAINPNDIYIDKNNEIFLVLSHSFNELTSNMKYINNQLIYNQTDKPFFVHGPASTYLDNIIENIGILNPDKQIIQQEIYNDFWNKKIYILIPHFLNEKIDLIIIILLVILIIILIVKSNKKKY